MHERGAVGREVAAFLDATAGTPIGRASGRFGPGVDPDLVREVWDHVTEGTHAEGALLDLEPAVGEMQCFSCETVYPGTKLDACPMCDGSGLPIVDPPELAIVSWGAR